jgi:hypothetical protein
VVAAVVVVIIGIGVVVVVVPVAELFTILLNHLLMEHTRLLLEPVDQPIILAEIHLFLVELPLVAEVVVISVLIPGILVDQAEAVAQVSKIILMELLV